VPDGDNNLKAFDLVKESAIQVITLASGAIVLSATFYKDVLGGAPKERVLLELCLGVFSFCRSFLALSYSEHWPVNWRTLRIRRTYIYITGLFATQRFCSK
jgi:hypothetical protein